MELITVILITAGTSLERTEYVARTIRSFRKHVLYPNLRWFIGDDGSDQNHIDTILDELDGCVIAGIWSEKNSYGKSANEGIRSSNDLMFFLEDDWELQVDLDLDHYASLLLEDESVGMVRLGYLNAEITGTTFGYGSRMYWRLSDESAYIFTGHPSLRHRRFHDRAGMYTEMLQPGETELAMAWSYKDSPSPKPSIVWPSWIGQYGYFGHIGSVQSYTWNGTGVIT